MGRTASMELLDFLRSEKLVLKLQSALEHARVKKFDLRIDVLHRQGTEGWRTLFNVPVDPFKFDELKLAEELGGKILEILGESEDLWVGTIRFYFSPNGRSYAQFDTLQQKLEPERDETETKVSDEVRDLRRQLDKERGLMLAFYNGLPRVLEGAGKTLEGSGKAHEGYAKVLEAHRGPAPVSAGAELVKALGPVMAPAALKWLEGSSSQNNGTAVLPPEEKTQLPPGDVPKQLPAPQQIDGKALGDWARANPAEAIQTLRELAKSSGMTPEQMTAMLMG